MLGDNFGHIDHQTEVDRVLDRFALHLGQYIDTETLLNIAKARR
jgi:hypothetical protein